MAWNGLPFISGQYESPVKFYVFLAIIVDSFRENQEI